MTGDRDRARLALEEIEFDRATGRLSPADYEALRRRYEAELHRAEPTGSDGVARPAVVAAPTSTTAGDRAEALIKAKRAEATRCPQCGPRPEADALCCSSCGRYLHACLGCGATGHPVGARYCGRCGVALSLAGA